MSQPNRLPADAAHQFGGIAIDRGKPLAFRLNGRALEGFAGDTVLSAVLAAGINTFGRFGETQLGLTDRLAPLVTSKGSGPLPIDRLPAADGLELTTVGRRQFTFVPNHTLGHIIDGIPEAPWLRQKPDATLTAELLIVGGGVAGLAAADAAANVGYSVILVEQRPWLGGDARYFGPVGDEASPEAVTKELITRIGTYPHVTVMTNAAVFALHGTSARVHSIADGRGTVTAVTAKRVLLASGSVQRLPIFAGNRLPGVISAISAYHLAKRYGVAIGQSAAVATQSNYGYRLAMRLGDAGVEVKRIVDPRVNPESRFVDFAKASGLKLAGGQIPVAASLVHRKLHAGFANIGTPLASLELEVDALIASGPFQPDLTLWMLAGGGTAWGDGKLMARGNVEHVALAGSAAGYRSMSACAASGRGVVAELFGSARAPVEDAEIGALYETPEMPTTIAPVVAGAPAFLDAGISLIVRPDPAAKPARTTHAQAPSLCDVAASVELDLTLPADAGAVAEERGAPGGDLAAADWTPKAAVVVDGPLPWLAGRFGDETETIRLVVDGKRRFERGALVYSNTSPAEPAFAIGVIESQGDAEPGGLAIVSSKALRNTDRFIVETLDGPSPARVASAHPGKV